MQNVNNIYDQQQRYNDYNQPPMQQRGFNVGETYTEDFRNGGTSNNRRPTRQTQPPPTKTPRTRQSSQQHGTNFVKQRLEQYQSNYMDRDRQQDDQDIRRQSSFNNDEQFSYFDGIEDDWGSRSDDRIPNSSYQRRGDDNSYNMPPPPDYEDVDEYRTMARDQYDEPVGRQRPRESRYDSSFQCNRSNTRPSNQYQQPPPPPPISRDDNMMRNEDTERIYDQWQQERYQADEQQRQRQYDEESSTRSRESTRPRYSPNTSTKGYGPGNSFRPQSGFQRGNPRRQETQPPYYPYGPSSRLNNSNGIMGMFDRLMNPYSTFSPSIMMGRLSNAMAKSMAQENQSNKYLLSDASKILSNDVAVKNMLGSSIELGTPFSKTSSSSMVNGVTKSRLELVVPVSGSENTGRIRLISNQDGIMQMELDVGGRIINVPLDSSRRRYDDAIDADIEDIDREVY